MYHSNRYLHIDRVTCISLMLFAIQWRLYSVDELLLLVDSVIAPALASLPLIR